MSFDDLHIISIIHVYAFARLNKKDEKYAWYDTGRRHASRPTHG